MEEVVIGVHLGYTWSFTVCKTSAYIVLIHNIMAADVGKWRNKQETTAGGERIKGCKLFGKKFDTRNSKF